VEIRPKIKPLCDKRPAELVGSRIDGRYGIFWRQSDYHVTRKWCALLF
jgi:hypothetical protein